MAVIGTSSLKPSKQGHRGVVELFGSSLSVVVILAQRWEATIGAKPSGGRVSPVEAHAEFLLGLVAEQGI